MDIPVYDNFYQDRLGRWFWDDGFDSFLPREDGERGLTVVRIHGFINWHRYKDGSIEKIRIPTPISEEGESLREMMIFPTRFKDIYSHPYFPLYHSFSRSLDNSDVLFVIGHSLRDEYLLAAIREQIEEKSTYVVIIDPMLPMAEEIQNFAHYDDLVIHLPVSIEKASPILIQLLRDFDLDSGSRRLGLSEMIEHLYSVQTSIRQKKKDRIAIDDWQIHVHPGEQLDLVVDLDTTYGGGELKLWLLRNKKNKEGLSFELISSGSSTFYGMHKEKRTLRSWCQMT